MSARRKFKPYVRRANGREKADSLRVAYRLAFYQSLGKPFFVMVQHGFPNLAVAVDKSKRDVKKGPAEVYIGWKTFRQWAADTQNSARGWRKRKSPIVGGKESEVQS